MASLRSNGHHLAQPIIQLEVLNQSLTSGDLPRFEGKMETCGYAPLRAGEITTLQVNLGKMCNQTCAHCHVDAGPDRKEIMEKRTMEECLSVVKHQGIRTVDLTGGAPEMNPHFRWFVESLRETGVHVMVRCNLTIIVANPVYHDLPQFYADHGVEVISSLPHFSEMRTDAQRGQGVFERSIRALKMLNEAGFGLASTGLKLHLVYNPSGAFLPPDQKSLERDFKRKLDRKYGIRFNDLYAITNMPISRFLEYLVRSGNYEQYMAKLIEAFNPLAVEGLMCRNTLSVGWDGYLYDCDFNQMLDIRVTRKAPQHISAYDLDALSGRVIKVDQHCYGCTAGAGSSCGGEII